MNKIDEFVDKVYVVYKNLEAAFEVKDEQEQKYIKSKVAQLLSDLITAYAKELNKKIKAGEE